MYLSDPWFWNLLINANVEPALIASNPKLQIDTGRITAELVVGRQARYLKII